MRTIVCLLACVVGTTAFAQTPLPRSHPGLKPTGKVLPAPRPHSLRVAVSPDSSILRNAGATPSPLPPARPVLHEPSPPAGAIAPRIADVPAPRSRPEEASHRPVEPPALRVAAAVPMPQMRPVPDTPRVPPALDWNADESVRTVSSVPLPNVRPSDAGPLDGAAAGLRQPAQPALDPIVKDEPQPLTVASVPLPALRPAEPAARSAARFTLGALRRMYENELREAREREQLEPPDSPADPTPASPSEPVQLAAAPAAEPASTPAAAPPPAENTATAAVLPAVSTRVAPALPMPVILRIPTPPKRPNDAMPRLFDAVFRELRVKSPGSECAILMTSGVIEADRLPGIGRGACHVSDAVRINAIVMPDRRRVEFVPAATMRCSMALEIINWVRGDVEQAARVFKSPIVGIRNYDSYNCRHMSSSRRMLSEHGKGNALDINSLLLAGGQKIELTDRRVQRNFRDKLRLTACKRFKTVLGPGVPQHHDHIHVDLRKHFGPGGICHWNVR